MVEVATRTGIVLPHHCGYAFPRYPPLQVGMLCWMIALGVGVAVGRGVDYEVDYFVNLTQQK